MMYGMELPGHTRSTEAEDTEPKHYSEVTYEVVPYHVANHLNFFVLEF
jgi:hypothetical protein